MSDGRTGQRVAPAAEDHVVAIVAQCVDVHARARRQCRAGVGRDYSIHVILGRATGRPRRAFWPRWSLWPRRAFWPGWPSRTRWPRWPFWPFWPRWTLLASAACNRWPLPVAGFVDHLLVSDEHAIGVL